MSCTTPDDKRIPFGEVAKKLNEGLEQADVVRAAGLNRLARVRVVKETGLTREQARLQTKLGATHPRVVALQTKIAANVELQRDVGLGVSRAATPAVRAGENTWVLHGHVRNRARQGLPGLTVALYNENNQWIQELGHACTDKNGYFRLCYERPKAAAVETVGTVTGAETIAATTKTTRGPQVLIHVSDKQGATLFVDQRALTPELGQVIYREIILGDDATACAPPGGPQPMPGGRIEPGADKTGRYLGNSAQRELHDLKNVKPQCQVDEIKSEHRVYFATQKEASAAGYDFCAYCFGKERSKR